MSRVLWAIVLIVSLDAALAVAQNQPCIVPSPPAPPKPTGLEVRFDNPDGGARPCSGAAIVPGSSKAPAFYPLGGAKCDQAKAIADQAAANDNGWNDGGSP